MNNLEDFEKTLGIHFKNQQLLKEALTHRSYLNEFKKEPLVSNERLEFLGDAILSFVVSNWIFKELPAFPEGKLTNLRSNLVKTGALAKIAKKIKIGDYLRLSHGEKESGGQTNESLLANATEALIGAIFLDQGINVIENFIKKQLNFLLKETLSSGRLKDYKSLLQEKIQAVKGQSPIYLTEKEEGPEHNKIFTINVLSNNKILAKGIGKSKQKAEQEAAKAALEKLGLKK